MKPIYKSISLTILAIVAGLALTARANGPRDLFSSNAAPSHGRSVAQQPGSPLIKAPPTRSLWSNDDIIYDSVAPNQQNGNEMTEWI